MAANSKTHLGGMPVTVKLTSEECPMTASHHGEMSAYCKTHLGGMAAICKLTSVEWPLNVNSPRRNGRYRRTSCCPRVCGLCLASLLPPLRADRCLRSTGNWRDRFSKKYMRTIERNRVRITDLWGNAQIFNHIWGGGWSQMTLRPIPVNFLEFPYIWGKFYFIFYFRI